MPLQFVTSQLKDLAVTNDKLAGSIANGKLSNSTVAFGGVSLALGASDTTPAFDLSDATAYPTSSLVGTITNAQLAGSIANGKLATSTVSYGGVTLALGASDATPAFNLSDATAYPTSALVGTITNAQLAGSILNAKLSNSSVSYGGVTLALGATDATPAFDLIHATNYPTSSLTGTITNAQLAGSIAFTKLADSANIARLNQAETVAAIWSFGSNLPTASANPTGDTQLARKAYVDSVAQGLDIKDSCKIATTANITLSGTQTIDGVAISAGQRVLVKDQSTATQNGIYLCAAGAWSRASDFATGDDEAGAFTFIEQGTVNAESGWVCTNNAGGAVVGTDNLAFAQFSGAGQVIAGNGLEKSGNTLSVDLASDAGLEISSGELRVQLDGNSGLNRVANGMSLKLDGATLSLGGGGIKIADSGVANAQVSASAAIAFSKMESVTSGRLLVGSAGNVPTAVALSGDATIIASGAMTIANDAISTAKIVNDAVNNDKIANNAVQAPQIATSAVLLAKLGTSPQFDRTSISNGTTATLNLSQQITEATWRHGGNVAVFRNGQRLRYKASAPSGLDQYTVADNGSATRVDFGANLENGDDIFITYIK